MLDFSYNLNCNFAVLGNCGLIHLVIIICHIIPFSIVTCAGYSDSVKISFKVCLVVTSSIAAKVSPIATHKQKTTTTPALQNRVNLLSLYMTKINQQYVTFNVHSERIGK